MNWYTVKIAFRILYRNKTYVIISLVSLGFAMACCILAYINYSYTTSFDSQYTNTENIYRLNSNISVNGGVEPWGLVPEPLVDNIVNDHTYKYDYARIINEGIMVKKDDNIFHEKITYVDASFFDFFNMPFKWGDYSTMDINTVVLGHAFSKKLFGDKSPLGSQISLLESNGSEVVYKVVGVLDKLPKNSSFQFDIITPIPIVSQLQGESNWANSRKITTFFKIKDSKNLSLLEDQMNSFLNNQKDSYNQWKVQSLYFQPFKEIAYSSDSDFSSFVEGRDLKRNLRGLVVIVPAVMSLLILLITCFNYINISIAMSSNRLKEIGLRKVVGGNRPQLIRQFLIENQIVCFLSAAIAFVLVVLLLPPLNSYAGIDLKIDFLGNIGLWIFLLGLPFLTALVSGLYPAFYVTSFTPIAVLNGKLKFRSFGRMTKFLLTSQFTFSCLALVVGIFLMQNALYQENADYGYNMDEIAVVEIANASEYEIIKDQLSQNPKILEFAGSQDHIGGWARTSLTEVDNQEINATIYNIGGEGYLNTMGVTLVQGQLFLAGESVDQNNSVLMNQTFVKQMNLADPLGKEVFVDSTYYNIVGVVADYKQNGLRKRVPPCVLKKANINDYKYIAVKSHSENLRSVRAYLKDVWYNVFPNKPYKAFLQTDLVYKERMMNVALKNIALFLAFITILLSASGLYALISLKVIERKKEIGIRKVMGASLRQILRVMSKELMFITAIAFLTGSVLGFLLVQRLIFNIIFAYHAPIGIGAFLGTFIIMTLATVFTVGSKVYQSAMANPVEALRNE